MSFDSTIDIVLFIIQIIGCLSFSTSGAIRAIRKKTDILGVWVLTLIEIFGGGLLRDLIINKEPPHIFWDVEYLILAGISIIISTIWFLIGYFPKTANLIEKKRHDFWIYLLDALGTSAFVVCGVQLTASMTPDTFTTFGKYVYIITLGVITGIGGGIFRDVFVGDIPTVFKKHFYMTPCIIGAGIYTVFYLNSFNQYASIFISMGVMVTLRVLATIYRWNLPTAKGYNQLIENSQDTNKK
jgi:uncharacterized membrane protein YeiH